MTLSNRWSTTIGQNSQGNYGFIFEAPDGTPYPIDGLAWEYVIRSPQRRTDRAHVVITTTPGPAGFLTVTLTPSSMVQLTVSPDATADIFPGSYEHALWSNPGTDEAYLWVVGTLTVQSVAQP